MGAHVVGVPAMGAEGGVMPKHWKEFSPDDILDFEGSQTALTARYDRILQHRATEATRELTSAVAAAGQAAAMTADNLKAGSSEVARKLEGVMETIYRATDRTEANLTALGDRTEKSFEALGQLYERAGRAQTKAQIVLIGLTAVLTIATVAYTWTTWLSVQAMHEANTIARQGLETQARAAAQNPAPHQAQTPAGH
jgi:hypothetical protein